MSAITHPDQDLQLADDHAPTPSWWDQTEPFSTDQATRPASFELRQVGDDDFQLLRPFRYTSADGSLEIPVRPELLGRTDLASIPGFLGWFARRHGRHTAAALLHDQLITDTPEQLPADLRMAPATADRLFRQALRASGVALVKSWVLWTGVTLRTRWHIRPWGAAGIAAWFLAALSGTSLLVYGALTGSPLLVAIALVAPIPFAGLWGRQFAAGLIAGYALWPVAFGSAPAWLVYQLYQATEHLARLLGRLRPPSRRTPLPPPKPFSKR